MALRSDFSNSALHHYMLDHSVSEPDVLARLRTSTSEIAEAAWQVSPEQGQFMALLAEISGARRTLEVGTFTGYGTLWMALALPEDGEIITCEIEPSFPAIGRPFWSEAGVLDKIVLRLGPALETLDALIASGEAGRFDLAFVDADKPPYPDYYARCVELVRTGGLILIDNVFWGGAVIDQSDNKRSTRAIRKVNKIIHADPRVKNLMLPVGDGLTIARKI